MVLSIGCLGYCCISCVRTKQRQVVLNGGQHISLTARDGSFAFRDVTPGVYLLEVLSPNFHYSAMKVKVDDKTGIIAIEYKVLHVYVLLYCCITLQPFLF